MRENLDDMLADLDEAIASAIKQGSLSMTEIERGSFHQPGHSTCLKKAFMMINNLFTTPEGQGLILVRGARGGTSSKGD